MWPISDFQFWAKGRPDNLWIKVVTHKSLFHNGDSRCKHLKFQKAKNGSSPFPYRKATLHHRHPVNCRRPRGFSFYFLQFYSFHIDPFSCDFFYLHITVDLQHFFRNRLRSNSRRWAFSEYIFVRGALRWLRSQLVDPWLGTEIEMENLIALVNRLQRACTALGDHGEESALPTLWDALPSIAVVGGQVWEFLVSNQIRIITSLWCWSIWVEKWCLPIFFILFTVSLDLRRCLFNCWFHHLLRELKFPSAFIYFASQFVCLFLIQNSITGMHEWRKIIAKLAAILGRKTFDVFT